MALSEYFTQLGNQRIWFADAVPTTLPDGMKVGDVVWHTDAAAGEAFVWYLVDTTPTFKAVNVAA